MQRALLYPDLSGASSGKGQISASWEERAPAADAAAGGQAEKSAGEHSASVRLCQSHSPGHRPPPTLHPRPAPQALMSPDFLAHLWQVHPLLGIVIYVSFPSSFSCSLSGLPN